MGVATEFTRCLPRPPSRRIEEAVERPLIEKFRRDSHDDRTWGSRRTPDSDASTTPTTADPRPDADSNPETPATGTGHDGATVSAAPDGAGVRLRVGGETRRLSRETARELRSALGDALTDAREFVHTVGRHREDGSYVVERRGADSAGHRKVFDSFAACRRLYESLPATFAATDLDAPGVSGGRRHMLAWHFAEHPAFDCSLGGRQPLTVEKASDAAGPSPVDEDAAEVVGD